MDKQPLLGAESARRGGDGSSDATAKSNGAVEGKPLPSGSNNEDRASTPEFRKPIPSLAIDYAAEMTTGHLDDGGVFTGTSDKGPFERLDPNPGPLEFVKILLLGVTLLPLRFVAALTTLVVYYILGMIYVATHPRKTYPRDALRGLSRFVARSILFYFGFHRIDVYGDDSLRDDTVMIVSNHVSFWEILYFMSSPSCPAFAFKSDCLKVPLVGEIALKLLQGIKIDRGDGAGAGTKAMIEAVRLREMESPGKYRPLLVFPEGTTGNGSSVITFRTGSFVPGAPVRPAVVNFQFRTFSPAYESIYTSVLMLRTLTQFNNRMEVRYLDSYEPSKEERADPKLYAENVRKEMAKAANLPLCEASYKDKKNYHRRLGKRLAAHPWGWRSNFLYINPKSLPEEVSMEPMVYRYSSPW